MKRLAIVEPRTLLGEAVRQAIDSDRDPWRQVDLLTADAEGVGGVTEVSGQATLVHGLESDSLNEVDAALFCGPQLDPAVLAALPASSRAIVVAAQQTALDATSIVAGVNLEDAAKETRIASDNPAVVMLAHLLNPLTDCGRIGLVAHVLQPASARDQPGLDELFQQTRSILAMNEDRPEEVYGTQLAFNLLPWQGAQGDPTAALASVLKRPLEAQIHTSQAGVFHCCSAALFLDLERDPGLETLQEMMLEDPLVELHDEPEHLGPVAAAATDRILLGPVTRSPSRGYWIWAVVDNLTCLANNALAIARY